MGTGNRTTDREDTLTNVTATTRRYMATPANHPNRPDMIFAGGSRHRTPVLSRTRGAACGVLDPSKDSGETWDRLAAATHSIYPDQIDLVDPVRTSAPRHALGALAAGRAPRRILEDSQVAVTEIVTNAVRHGDRPINVRIWADTDGITASVHGAGRTSRSGTPASGAAMMNATRSMCGWTAPSPALFPIDLTQR